MNFLIKRVNRVLLSCLLLCVSAYSTADTIEAQRNRYRLAEAALNRNEMAVFHSIASSLKQYPLYPYLEYARLTKNINQVTNKEIDSFLQQFAQVPLSTSLRNRYLKELARRETWRDYLHYVPQPPLNTEQSCNYYYALYRTGEVDKALVGIAELWQKQLSLPDSCDRLVMLWRRSGKQQTSDILQRINLASNAGNRDGQAQANFLSKQLTGQNKLLAEAIIDVYQNPSTLISFAQRYPATEFNQQITLNVFRKLAKTNNELARAQLDRISKWQKLNDEQKSSMEQIVSSYLINANVNSEQAAWRDKVIAKGQDTNLVERRLRLALLTGDIRQVEYWRSRLPAEAKNKDEWRYWQAEYLLTRGDKQEGRNILKELMMKRGYYPMVAAQRLGEIYIVRATPVTGRVDPTLLGAAAMMRIRELLYWGSYHQARVEWVKFVDQQDIKTKEKLAKYAYEQNWPDFSVQATISGKLWDHLRERFPVAYKSIFTRELERKEITLSFAMAISRQESAWNFLATSPAGARGLMQLMPGTAKEVAAKNKVKTYKSSSQLLQPEMNIQLGVIYLDQVYRKFNYNRALAAAAYNAGPHRVNQWLSNSGGRLNILAFVEAIPFTETRNYVKNVLSYDLFYRHFMGIKGNVFTEEEWSEIY